MGDVFRLKKEDLATLPGFKDKSIKNLLDAIEGAKARPIDRLLVGLGIRHVGGTAAIRISDGIPSIDGIAAASAEELAAVDGVGTVIAQAVHEYFARDDIKALVEKLREGGVRMTGERRKAEGHLLGKSFVITGTLESLSRTIARPHRGDSAASGGQRLQEDRFRGRRREPCTKLRRRRIGWPPSTRPPSWRCRGEDAGPAAGPDAAPPAARAKSASVIRGRRSVPKIFPTPPSPLRRERGAKISGLEPLSLRRGLG